MTQDIDVEVTPGFTLAEALMRWGDPAAVAEMTQLAKEGYDGPLIFVLGEPESEYERNVLRYRELRAQLERNVIEKLINGPPPVATGYDTRAPIDAPRSIIPGDRFSVLTPNFDDSSATGAGITITGILVYDERPATAPSARAPQARLEIGRATRRVRFGDTDLRLSPRSFELLLVLAEAAVADGAPVLRRDIETRLWSGQISKKAASDAVHKLKRELVEQGVAETDAQLLIENVPAVGYRLTGEPSGIRIVE